MRIASLISVLLLIALASGAGAVVLIGNNPNVNGGGLNMAPPGVWTKVGAGPNARLDNDHNGIIPDDGGDWAVGGSDGSGSSPPYNNYYSQIFALSGLYDISLSGWAKAWAGWWGGEDFQWVQEAHIELLVDNVMVADLMSSNNTNRDQWKFWTWSGQQNIAATLEVRLHSVKGNSNYGQGPYGAIFFDSRYDDITLTVDLVPEPSSLLALGFGAFGLGGWIIRRRK